MDIKKVPINKSECCGCGECVNICPKQAIVMISDEEGFLYPQIDENRCINCLLCTKQCSFFYPTETVVGKIDTCYVAKHRNQAVRMNSRSGGIFVAVSDWIFKKNGVVYGCVLDQELRAIHIRATSPDDRNAMCKSKYVQSNTNDVYQSVLHDLNEGKYVLFSGTGCQVDAIIKYLRFKKVDSSKFYTVDIVCHGCASPQLFSDYIKFIEKKKGKIESFEFRDKTLCGWDGHTESYVIKGKKHSSIIWRELFHTDASIRPSCYNCKYAKVNHISDITIADAWGIKQALPEFNDNRGVSMFIVQNERGKELLEAINQSCDVVELPIDKMMQANLTRPSYSKVNREEFWELYYKNGFEQLIKKYAKLPFYRRVKAWLIYKIRKVIKKNYYLP